MLAEVLQYHEHVIVLAAIIGIVITWRTLLFNLKQRKIENTYRTIEYLRKHINKKQIEKFIDLFHANNSIAFPPQEFHFINGRRDHVENMFSEGGCGNGAIHNMIEVFNLVSVNLYSNELEDDLIWYEYGQIMMKCFQWTSYLEEHALLASHNKGLVLRLKSLLSQKKEREGLFYYHFNRYVTRRRSNKKRSPVKHYTYVE